MLRVVPLILTAGLVGCSSKPPPESPRPPVAITLADGIQMVVKALDEFVAEEPPERYNGLVPAEVVVVFKVEAGHTTEASGSAELKVVEILSVGAQSTSAATETTANTITIRFRSIAFARKDEVIGFHERS